VDPLAPKYPHNSPYAFSENRVVDGVELEGLEWDSVKNDDGEIVDYKWVGYNEDGTAKEGSVAEATLTFRLITTHYTSNDITKTGFAKSYSKLNGFGEVNFAIRGTAEDFDIFYNETIAGQFGSFSKKTDLSILSSTSLGSEYLKYVGGANGYRAGYKDNLNHSLTLVGLLRSSIDFSQKQEEQRQIQDQLGPMATGAASSYCLECWFFPLPKLSIFKPLYSGTGLGINAAKGSSAFFQGAKYSPKVLRQMSKADDLFHGFSKSVDGYATKFGQWSTKVGADGKSYQWLKMQGSYGGKTGTFEFIKDANGVINHRFFNVH